MLFAGRFRSPYVQCVRVVTDQLAGFRIVSTCRNIHPLFSRYNKRCAGRAYSSSTTLKSPLHGLRQRTKEQPLLAFVSTSDNPYHNLAIEHFILTNSDVDSRILLFYTNRPCVVIGRNQNPWTECNLELIRKGIDGQTIDLVRRRSGGGTVFHDEGNLNFSVIVPNDKSFNRKKHSEMVVRALNEVYAVSAEYDGPDNIWVNERHDITMATMQNKGRSVFKVSGSAFKLTRGRALHHGTLLHSSPNLDNISRLLRSPGKNWIQAKGVESVRSPVMNIYNVQTAEERNHLRSQIMIEVTEAFSNLYGSKVEPEVVGDDDCLQMVNPSVADGVEELLTDEWRFGQTPRFEFTSNVIDSKQVTFAVKNGMIENARFGSTEVSVDQREPLEMLKQQKFHQIQDWCDVFNPEIVDGDLLASVGRVFPNLQELLHNDTADSHLGVDVVDRREDILLRRHQDGSLEKETRPNTIEVTNA